MRRMGTSLSKLLPAPVVYPVSRPSPHQLLPRGVSPGVGKGQYYPLPTFVEL